MRHIHERLTNVQDTVHTRVQLFAQSACVLARAHPMDVCPACL